MTPHKGPPPAEVTTVIRLVREHRPALVNVGHGRTARSLACARAFVEAWEVGGGAVGAMVSWPQAAASWQRPACRLVAGLPDVWVIAEEADGWTGIGRRLIATGVWRPSRTIGFAGLASPGLPALAGSEATDGLCGSLPDGAVWTFRDGSLTDLTRDAAGVASLDFQRRP
jgi:hypothetical protein